MKNTIFSLAAAAVLLALPGCISFGGHDDHDETVTTTTSTPVSRTTTVTHED